MILLFQRIYNFNAPSLLSCAQAHLTYTTDFHLMSRSSETSGETAWFATVTSRRSKLTKGKQSQVEFTGGPTSVMREAWHLHRVRHLLFHMRRAQIGY